MELVTIDFETFYDRQYSLSKITTEEYVRDPQFQIIGVGIKIGNTPAHWVSFATEQEYRRYLAFLEGCMVLCHNTMFDGAILSWRLGIKPKFWLDTLSMSRPLHGLTVGGSLKKLAEHYEIGAKGTEVLDALGKRREHFSPDELTRYGEYCKNDVELTHQLFKLLNKGFAKDELRLIDQTIRLFTEPVLQLDKPLLETHLRQVQERKAKLLDKIEDIAGKDALMSNPKFADVLRSCGVEPPLKTSLRTGKETYAFGKNDKAFTALLEHEDPKVQALVAARLGVKSTLEETRTERLIGMADRGAMPVPLNYCGAVVTGRHSGADKSNYQNLPRGGTIRQAIKAPPGHKLVACDSSNIELRVNHTLAGQSSSVESFRTGRDLYCEFASVLYGREITKADKAERMLGKIAHLGLGYGMGWKKFKETARLSKVNLEDAEAERIVNLWRETYHHVPWFWRQGEKALAAIARGVEMTINTYGLIRTSPEGLITPPNNMIRYPHLRKTEDGWDYWNRREAVKIYSGKVVENICQHLARNIIANQWLEIAKRYRVVLQVHDEIVACVPEAEAEEAKAFMVEVMSRSPDWWPDVPLAAEADIGDSYGDAK